MSIRGVYAVALRVKELPRAEISTDLQKPRGVSMMRRLFVLFVIVFGFGLMLMPAVIAETLTVTPGKWEITSTVTSSKSPQPQTKTITECIKRTEIDPFEELSKGKECQISDVKKTGNSLSGKVNCVIGPGMPPMTGLVEYSVSGETMKRHLKFESPQYSQEMHSEGKRVGECD